MGHAGSEEHPRKEFDSELYLRGLNVSVARIFPGASLSPPQSAPSARRIVCNTRQH